MIRQSAHIVADGEVIEVLPTFGIAHVRVENGVLIGIRRQTPGLSFERIQVGQRVRVTLEPGHLRATTVEFLD